VAEAVAVLDAAPITKEAGRALAELAGYVGRRDR
jgi:hypothetical protein